MEKDLVNNQGDGQKENEEYEFHSSNHWLSRPGEFLSLVDWWPLVYQLTFYLNNGVSFCSQKKWPSLFLFYVGLLSHALIRDKEYLFFTCLDFDFKLFLSF